MAPIKSHKTSKPSLGRVTSSPKSTSKSSSKSTPSKVKKPFSKPKTKSAVASAKTKKKRVYTEKELGIPTLNGIVPAGVQKVKGKKKGKVFVDDTESMMTILAIVNAEKEGEVESKIIKARQMEEIREARRKEAEARQDIKKGKFEDTKDSLRKGRKRKGDADSDATPAQDSQKLEKKSKKKVSFG